MALIRFLNSHGSHLSLFRSSALAAATSLLFANAGHVQATDALTYHNAPQSFGVNATEKLLTPDTVTVAGFAKNFSTLVDGQVYAQPLYKTGVTVTSGSSAGLHNLVFVATQHDSVYAIDSTSGKIVWQTSLLTIALPPVFTGGGIPGSTLVTPVPSADVNSDDLTPEIGICSTPVIDATNHILYVSAKTKQVVSGDTSSPHYVYGIYKIDITTGNVVAKNLFADTVNIGGNYIYRTATALGAIQDPFVSGTGDGSITINNTHRVYFNAQRQLNRAALTENNGRIYLGFASHGDNGPYHGWILGFNMNTLALAAVFNATPNGSEAGIWQSGGKLAADAAGFLYCETGNGTFEGYRAKNGKTGGLTALGFPENNDYGDAFLKLAVDKEHTQAKQGKNGWGLAVVDYFSPSNNHALSASDFDLGSGGCMVVPPAAGSRAHPNLLVGGGKEGKIYLIDRAKMGKFDGNQDHVVEETVSGFVGEIFDTPSYFNGVLYYFGTGDTGTAYKLTAGHLDKTPLAFTPNTFSFPGPTASISANGLQNGIVWAIDHGTNQLRAYTTSSFTHQLWSSADAPNGRDDLESSSKFAVPTVVDGSVFIGTADSLVAYSAPKPPTAPPAAPTDLTATGLSGVQVNLSWTDNSNNEEGFQIQASTDGTNFVTTGTANVSAQRFTVAGLQPGTPYYFRVAAFNSFNTQSVSATTNIATAQTDVTAPILDFSSGFFSSSLGFLSINPTAQLLGNRLELTDGLTNETGSVWTNSTQDIRKFKLNFQFQISGANADGFTFAIQNGDNSLEGNFGSGLGYEGIDNSIAIKFDIFPSQSTTGLYVNGATPDDTGAVDVTPAGLDFHSGHLFDVTLAYDGTTLTETITDTKTGASGTYTYAIDIPGTINSTSAYVGFTGGTGGETSVQDIVNWVYTVLP